MKIVRCDLHAKQRTIAMVDTETGEFLERTLLNEGDAVREFYAALEGPVSGVVRDVEISRLHSSWPSVWLPHIAHQASVPTLHRGEYKTILVNRGRGEDGTEFSPFASVLGPVGAERCQAGHVALPALRPRSPLPSFGHPTLFNEF
jgi:hypothetical protein